MLVWNKDAYIVVFGLCARLKDLNLGRQVHNKLLTSGVKYDECVCNAVMKMYGKCKESLIARKVFDRFEPPRNTAIWTTMLAAYLEHGSIEMTLKGFLHMKLADVAPDESTFCILLAASADLFSVRCGNLFHAHAVKTGFKGHKKVKDKDALIDMYSRTGDIKAAENVFYGGMTDYYDRDIVTWNTMICGYSLHGLGNEPLGLFEEMLRLGEDDPNDETFVGVVSACGHLGLVEQGFYYLNELMKQKGVEPGLEHYMCIINMLIKEALSLIVSTPSCKWDVFAWSTFLRGCQDHGNYALGIRAAELIPEDDVATKVGKWFLMEKSKERERGVSWMEFKNETYKHYSVHKGDPKFDVNHGTMKMVLHCP